MSLPLKLFISWYFSILATTELLSIFGVINRPYFLVTQGIILIFCLLIIKPDYKSILRNLIPNSKIYWIITILASMTFLQGLIGAPSTTDSMVYHLPRVLYWQQEQTLFQEVIRNEHDFMSPFGEYILLSLYFITGNDRLFFLSQWLAFLIIIYLSGVIATQIGAEKAKDLTRLLTATIPILLFQSSSTQIDLVVTALVVSSVSLSLFLVNKFRLNILISLAFLIALGVLTKPTFLIYSIIPAGIILYNFRKSFPKLFLTGLLTVAMILIITSRFFVQNLNLYGNLLGNHLLPDGQEVTYMNERITPSTFLSNSIRNLLTQIPFPVLNLTIESNLENLLAVLKIDTNDPHTSCCGAFKVLPVIYPQEDIVSNPLTILLIFFGISFIFISKKTTSAKLILILTVLTFFAFSTVLKWQPFHSRLLIPVFVLGTISSIALLQSKVRMLYYLSIISVVLSFVLIILNVSKPYVSYSHFYPLVEAFSKPNTSIPEAFYIKPRADQYFNARYYWRDPYNDILTSPEINTKNLTIAFLLEDNFEYPLWRLIKEKNNTVKVLPFNSEIKSQLLIKTSKQVEVVKNYDLIRCSSTKIEYGFICLYTLKLNEQLP